jgi:hypothetical protein
MSGVVASGLQSTQDLQAQVVSFPKEGPIDERSDARSLRYDTISMLSEADGNGVITD